MFHQADQVATTTDKKYISALNRAATKRSYLGVGETSTSRRSIAYMLKSCVAMAAEKRTWKRIIIYVTTNARAT